MNVRKKEDKVLYFYKDLIRLTKSNNDMVRLCKLNPGKVICSFQRQKCLSGFGVAKHFTVSFVRDKNVRDFRDFPGVEMI